MGVIDTGIDYNHADLKVNVKCGVSIVDGVTDFMNDNGHGTHCSGSIATTEGNAAGITGVAPKKWLYGIKMLRNVSGQGLVLL